MPQLMHSRPSVSLPRQPGPHGSSHTHTHTHTHELLDKMSAASVMASFMGQTKQLSADMTGCGHVDRELLNLLHEWHALVISTYSLCVS